MTVGARYTHETKKLRSDLVDNNLACAAFTGGSLAQLPCVIPSVTGGTAEIDGKRTENKLSGTVVLSYKPTDRLLTYASYARGYKAGGFNLDRSALAGWLGGIGPVLSRDRHAMLIFEGVKGEEFVFRSQPDGGFRTCGRSSSGW